MARGKAATKKVQNKMLYILRQDIVNSFIDKKEMPRQPLRLPGHYTYLLSIDRCREVQEKEHQEDKAQSHEHFDDDIHNDVHIVHFDSPDT